jgi:hypothetical protein
MTESFRERGSKHLKNVARECVLEKVNFEITFEENKGKT